MHTKGLEERKTLEHTQNKQLTFDSFEENTTDTIYQNNQKVC